MLTQDRLKALYSYDESTGVFTRLTARGGHKIGTVVGSTCNTTGYIIITIDYKRYKAHRLAWLYVHGVFPLEFIDHKNRVRDDNRLINLREATCSQNQQNRASTDNSRTGHIGVYRGVGVKKYQAIIKINKVAIHLGVFDNIEDAIIARKEAEEQYGHRRH